MDRSLGHIRGEFFFLFFFFLRIKEFGNHYGTEPISFADQVATARLHLLLQVYSIGQKFDQYIIDREIYY